MSTHQKGCIYQVPLSFFRVTHSYRVADFA